MWKQRLKHLPLIDIHVVDLAASPDYESTGSEPASAPADHNYEAPRTKGDGAGLRGKTSGCYGDIGGFRLSQSSHRAADGQSPPKSGHVIDETSRRSTSRSFLTRKTSRQLPCPASGEEECSQATQAQPSSVRAGSVSQRSRTGNSGHQRSPTVQRNHRSPALLAHAAGMMRAGDSDCGPEGPGWLRRAADGQQPVSVTTGEPARGQWRLLTSDPGIESH